MSRRRSRAAAQRFRRARTGSSCGGASQWTEARFDGGEQRCTARTAASSAMASSHHAPSCLRGATPRSPGRRRSWRPRRPARAGDRRACADVVFGERTDETSVFQHRQRADLAPHMRFTASRSDSPGAAARCVLPNASASQPPAKQRGPHRGEQCFDRSNATTADMRDLRQSSFSAPCAGQSGLQTPPERRAEPCYHSASWIRLRALRSRGRDPTITLNRPKIATA